MKISMPEDSEKPRARGAQLPPRSSDANQRRIKTLKTILLIVGWSLFIAGCLWIANFFTFKGVIAGSIGITFMFYLAHTATSISIEKLDLEYLKEDMTVFYVNCFLWIFCLSWLLANMMARETFSEDDLFKLRSLHFRVFFSLIGPSFLAVDLALRHRLKMRV